MEQNYFVSLPRELFENDLPTLHKIIRQTGTQRMDTHDKDGLIMTWTNYLQDRLYIPADSQLRTDIIREHHDTIAVDIQDDGKPGKLTRDYWWHAWQGQSRSTCWDATLPNAPNLTREKPRNPLHLTKFLLYLGKYLHRPHHRLTGIYGFMLF